MTVSSFGSLAGIKSFSYDKKLDRKSLIYNITVARCLIDTPAEFSPQKTLYVVKFENSRLIFFYQTNCIHVYRIFMEAYSISLLRHLFFPMSITSS